MNDVVTLSKEVFQRAQWLPVSKSTVTYFTGQQRLYYSARRYRRGRRVWQLICDQQQQLKASISSNIYETTSKIVGSVDSYYMARPLVGASVTGRRAKSWQASEPCHIRSKSAGTRARLQSALSLLLRNPGSWSATAHRCAALYGRRVMPQLCQTSWEPPPMQQQPFAGPFVATQDRKCRVPGWRVISCDKDLCADSEKLAGRQPQLDSIVADPFMTLSIKIRRRLSPSWQGITLLVAFSLEPRLVAANLDLSTAKLAE
jgi:hypothetical protein